MTGQDVQRAPQPALATVPDLADLIVRLTRAGTVLDEAAIRRDLKPQFAIRAAEQTPANTAA
jgi:hypothetical protein